MSTPAQTPKALKALVNVLRFKIAATVLCWCVPFLTFPAWAIEALGFPPQPHLMFTRLLGWAYLALCVGYGFALQEALQGRRLVGAIWVGVVSNGGACVLLGWHGASGQWASWGPAAQVMSWGSFMATGLITWGLVWFGLRRSMPRP